MDQAASQIVGICANILIGQITKHLGYVTSSTKNVVEMRNKMKILEGKSGDVKRHIETNNKDHKEVPPRANEWLGDVENVKNEVQRISGNNGIGCLNMKKRYRAGRKAFKTINDIQSLIYEEKEISWTDANIPLGRVDSKPASTDASISAPRETSTPNDFFTAPNDFASRDANVKKALKFLQQGDKVGQVIALCGMGGVGKTTMMEQLKKVAHDNKMFHWIVKVVVGKNVNMLSIQNDIATYIGDSDLPEASISVRADHLYNKFVKLSHAKEKTLLILDDVREKIELKDIGLRSPLPNGVKLLLTSRDSRVCTQIALDTDSVLEEVKVNFLTEAEAQKFFSQTTRVLEEDDPDKYLIGCDIAKRCGGLPMAIKLIASTLKSKEDYEWTNALNRLKNNDLDKDVQEIIKISYEYIEGDEDKQIFLHCSLFPEDSNIPIEDLTRHAWGLELLKDVSTLREARDRTNTCVHHLINANLLMESNHVGFVKMHDLVLAFVLGISKSDPEWIISHGDASKWDRDKMAQSCRRISLACSRDVPEFPGDSKYPNMSLLQLMNGDMSLMFPDDFYQRAENLKVIAYYNLQYPRLPTSLKNLKSLCLHECTLMFDCSIVGYLENLEVLSFAHCGIRKLPSKIGNLKRLKVLDLTGCINLHIEDGVFKNLENLEELYMRVSEGEAIKFTNANFEELKMLSNKLCALEVEFVEKNTWLESLSFKKLDHYKISMGSLLEEEKYDEQYLFKKTLKLVTNQSNNILECKIEELFKKTEKLHLHVKDMIRLADVSIHDQRSFHYLRDLEVSNCVNLKYLFSMCVASGLRKLERLTILSCSVLEALVHDYGKEISSEMIKFEKLKVLSLQNLPKLERLSTVENVVELPQLVELEVDGLPKFTSIFPDGNRILNSQVRISELRKLKVTSMETLTHIWVCSSEEEVNNISMLRDIYVVNCGSLVNLFPTNPKRLLNYLERVTVMECNSIEVIFNIDLQSNYVSDSEKVWRVNTSGFEDVKSIRISRCKKFRNLFTQSNTKFDMRALVDISINDCGESEISKGYLIDVAFPSSIIPTFPHHLSNLTLSNYETLEVVFELSNGEHQFPYLKNLGLQAMKMMSHVWKCDNWNKFLVLQKQHPQSSFHNLTTIYLHRCNRIKYLFSPLMAKLLSNLKNIRIVSCEGIEEVVLNQDNQDEEMTSFMNTHTTTKFFPRLHSLSLRYLRNLKRIGGVEFKRSKVNAASWSLCQYSRKIQIESCDTLLIAIPTYAVGQMQDLQVLKVKYCGSLIEVFETQWNMKVDSSTNTDKGIGRTNTIIRRLENINVPQLSNLKKVVITYCNLLQLVFTFSTLESLKQLEKLEIGDCEKMKVVVKEEIGKQRKAVGFPRLKSLKLRNLPNLEGFFLGMNNFHWTLLEKVMIDSCPEMTVFTSGQSTAPKLAYMHTSLGKHSLECGLNFRVTKKKPSESSAESTSSSISTLASQSSAECSSLSSTTSTSISSAESTTLSSTTLTSLSSAESTSLSSTALTSLSSAESTSLSSTTLTSLSSAESRNLSFTTLVQLPWSFHNLIELHMTQSWEVKAIIPSKELQQLQKLERIQLHYCFYLEEVFEVEAKKQTNSELQTCVAIPNLTQMEIMRVPNLKYIWNQKRMLMFPNLTTMSVDFCEKLEHVFTSSMVCSLSQLQYLHITKCRNMVAVVRVEEESELEGNAKVKKSVKLPCLKSLKLIALESLLGFCLGEDEFLCRSLHTLEIKECPEITVFAKGHVDTPNLKIVDTSLGRCYTGDINSFIKTIKHEGFQF